MRIRWSSLIPIAGSFLGWLSSPDVAGVLPDKYAHAVMLAGVLIQTVAPAVLTNKPPTDPTSH